MENLKEILVIYRLKFQFKQDFEKAVQTLRFGQSIGKYLESLQMSFGPQQSEPNYPTIRPPEINICHDDFVVYICSHEYRQYGKALPISNIMTGGTAEAKSLFPYYYEPFLRTSFGAVAEVTVTTGQCS
jgi:hypothetical protein